jgi:hypothetical protein
MFEAARDLGHPNLRPEGHPRGGRSDQDSVQIPAHDRLNSCPNRVARFRRGVYTWQDRDEVAIADQPRDGAHESGMVTADDDALRCQSLLNVSLKTLHT